MELFPALNQTNKVTIEETKKATAQVIKIQILYARIDNTRCLKGQQMAWNLSNEIETAEMTETYERNASTKMKETEKYWFVLTFPSLK